MWCHQLNPTKQATITMVLDAVYKLNIPHSITDSMHAQHRQGSCVHHFEKAQHESQPVASSTEVMD